MNSGQGQTLTLNFQESKKNVFMIDEKKNNSPKRKPPTQSSSNQYLFNFNKNKREIREMLHPNSNKDHLPDSESLWVQYKKAFI